MKYYFEPYMFEHGDHSLCYSLGENLALSSLDVTGVEGAYPKEAPAALEMDKRQQEAIRLIKSLKSTSPALKQRLESMVK